MRQLIVNDIGNDTTIPFDLLNPLPCAFRDPNTSGVHGVIAQTKDGPRVSRLVVYRVFDPKAVALFNAHGWTVEHNTASWSR